MAAQGQNQSPNPAPTPEDKPSDWFVRTMAGDLEELRSGKHPQEAAVKLKTPPQEGPGALPETPPTAVKLQQPAPPAPSQGVAVTGAPPAMLPVAPLPSVRPPAPPHPTKEGGASSIGIPKEGVLERAPKPLPLPPLPPQTPHIYPAPARPTAPATPPPPPHDTIDSPHENLWPPRLPLLIASGAFLFVAFVVLAVILDMGGIKTFFTAEPPSQSPEPTSVEGEIVLKESPTPAPSLAPTPAIASDDTETVSATSQTVVDTLNRLAVKARAPGTLTALRFTGLSSEDALAALGIKSSAFAHLQSPSTTAMLYFWTQRLEQVPRIHAVRLVAVIEFRYAQSDAGVIIPSIEMMLNTTARPLIWLNNSPGTQAAPGFQNNTYKSVSVRYLNFSLPDLSLDYALIPDKQLLLIATSQEAIYAVLDRLNIGGK